MQEYIDYWRNYTNFSGRTSVRGYWIVVLCNVIVGFAVGIVCGILGVIPIIRVIARILPALVSLVMLVPSLAIAFRRLHDIGKSGVYLLFGLIPLVGWIFLLVWFVQPSQGPNMYGNPVPDSKPSGF